MAGPYTKRQDSTAIDDGWTITDGDGYVLAHLDTECLVNWMMDVLLGRLRDRVAGYNHPADYAKDTPYGGSDNGDEAEEA